MNSKGQTSLKEKSNIGRNQAVYYFRFNDKKEVEKCKNMLRNK